MRIKKLSVTCLRGITQGDFHFNTGMNLLVGINGVGKTTILEALRICLSQVLPNITISNNRKENFSIEDIKIGQPFMSIRFDVERKEKELSIVLNQSREKYEYNYDFFRFLTIKDFNGERSFSKSDQDIFRKDKKQPIVLYFSTKRSLISNKAPAKSTVSGGQLAAYAEALSANRGFNLPTL
jgi:predicted ATP-binding protein involved in virulence